MTDGKSKKAIFAVKVLRDGRVTIPEDQRKKLGIEVGDWIKLVMEKMEE
jgi:bifunctional DNA-binding transcriptional regulator/antitoxin component of YhaV-PrlF toxin-antitoxin module